MTDREPNCANCLDKGWRGKEPCPFCNRNGQFGTPERSSDDGLPSSDD